jgi:hypothetical protein
MQLFYILSISCVHKYDMNEEFSMKYIACEQETEYTIKHITE